MGSWAGLSLVFTYTGTKLAISLAQTWRTRAFEGQGEPDGIGLISVSLRP